ncbi:hypothetical protein PC129_g25185 [Phytophthora cactorum]|uniref:Uncharacterized protein n=1 Tax=Phytophthora cactorum TaxID=29920 RepID=A0A8T1GUN8_9STRA|nr:hypothetical protein PC129_g25185 [Phytophthora cactorum]
MPSESKLFRVPQTKTGEAGHGQHPPKTTGNRRISKWVSFRRKLDHRVELDPVPSTIQEESIGEERRGRTPSDIGRVVLKASGALPSCTEAPHLAQFSPSRSAFWGPAP